MLKNFFKIAIRNLARHKSFSFLNIAGLALGLTTCILIGLLFGMKISMISFFLVLSVFIGFIMNTQIRKAHKIWL